MGLASCLRRCGVGILPASIRPPPEVAMQDPAAMLARVESRLRGKGSQGKP